MTKHYAATVVREGKWWMIEIPELDGLTQARKLNEAELMAREWVAATLDVPVEEIAVNITVDRVGAIDISERLGILRSERERAETLEREALIHATELAKALAAEQLTVREVGTIMGISFQRAHQLMKS